MKQILLSYLAVISIFASACHAEFQVNTRTSRDQASPAIAADAQGSFSVVWSSYFDDRSNDIIGQRFDSGGTPIGGEFTANSTTAGNQSEPAVATDNMGNFVVAWQGPRSIDDANEDIFAQRFDANGQPVGGEFRVNDDPNGRQLHPKVAMGKTGSFVIVWEDNRYYPQFDYYEILFKLYDSNGTVIEADSANLLTQCRYPDVAMDGNGDFTIVWLRQDNPNIILVRRYSANGTAKANPCQISTANFFTITHPSIACDGAGHFVVAWNGNPGPASQDNILAHRYKFDGTALTDEFTVNTTLTGTQENPDVAMDNRRQFIIVWNSEIDPNSNIRDIIGRRYDELANPIGDEFLINTYTFDDQKYPAVTIKETGEFITVWQSYGQDGAENGIFGDVGPKVGSADLTGDGFVNFCDYSILADEWLKSENPLRADLIDDDKIDEQDLIVLCQRWLRPCYQCSEVDIVGNGKIDFKDYACLAGNWLEKGANLDGDITGNGIVDMADLRALLFHWAQTCE